MLTNVHRAFILNATVLFCHSLAIEGENKQKLVQNFYLATLVAKLIENKSTILLTLTHVKTVIKK